jgi:hypothetical protein
MDILMKKLLLALVFFIAGVQASLPEWYENPVYDVAAFKGAIGDDQLLTETAEATIGRFFSEETELPAGVERKDFALFLAAQEQAPDVDALEKKADVLGQLEAAQQKVKNNFAKLVGHANGSMESGSVALLAGLLDGDAYYLYNNGLNTAHSVFIRTNTLAVQYGQTPMDVLQTIGSYHQLWLRETFKDDLYQNIFKVHQQQIEGEKVFAEGKFDPFLVGLDYFKAQYRFDKNDFFVPDYIKESYLEKKQQLAETHDYIKGLRIQLAKASPDKKQEVRAKSWEAIACIKDFWGQEDKPKYMPFGLFERKENLHMAAIQDCLSTPHGVVNKLFKHYMPNFDYLTPLFYFYSDAFELKKAIENPALSYHFFHGANSGILPAIESSKALIPTGFLGEYGIVPLSGELASGSTENGINHAHLSGANETYKGIKCAQGYADRKDFSVDQGAFKNYRNLFLEQSQELPSDLTEKELDRFNNSYFVGLERATHGFPHRIRQLKKVGLWKDDQEFREVVKRNLEFINNFEKTKRYSTEILPKSEGGKYHNYYYYTPFQSAKSVLNDCINALDAEIEPISAEESERLKPENLFPIVFTSALPGQVIYNLPGELRYNALLSLWYDIDAIFVPKDKMDLMSEWLVDKGIIVDGKGPKVFDVADVKNHARDYVDFVKPEDGAAAAGAEA